MKKYVSNKAGIPILDKRGQRVPVKPKASASAPAKPAAKGRTIAENLRVSRRYTDRATSFGAVQSGIVESDC